MGLLVFVAGIVLGYNIAPKAELKRIVNKNRRPTANFDYFCFKGYYNNKKIKALFTEDVVNNAIKRSHQNPEDH
jgi:hypothetical protein